MYRSFFAITIICAAGSAAFADARFTCLNLEGDKAIQACTSVLAVNRNDVEVLDYRALHYSSKAYNEKNRAYYDLAIADYNEAIKIAPFNATLVYRRGNVHRDKGEIDLAISDYSRAIELEPKDWVFLNSRGYAYTERGDYLHAIADFATVIALEPTYPSGYTGRAWAYLKAGQPASGLVDAEKSLTIRPNEFDALRVRGLIFEALNRREEAIADFRRALSQRSYDDEIKGALKRLGSAP